MYWRSRRRFRQDPVQTIFNSFNFEIRSPVRIPSPSYRGKPNIYPGRLWRLKWGEMEEPFAPNGTLHRSNSEGSHSAIGPTSVVGQTSPYKTYF